MKKKKSKSNDKPFGRLTVVDDFLPSPEKLAKSIKTRKVTMDLEEEIITFFKKAAAKTGSKYQRLMREVLKHYARSA